MNDKHLGVLKSNIELLKKATAVFQYSRAKCMSIGLKEHYNDDELEIFEAFSARFARISDILTQKLIKSIFIIERESNLSFLDSCFLAEKRGIINSADKLIEIRDLRNEIAHEYASLNLNEIFESCIELADFLLTDINLTISYADLLLNKLHDNK